MKTYQVDLDYESYLFDPAYDAQSSSTLKKQREFEYVFFLINRENCILKNCRGYSEKYLKSLKDKGFFIPKLDPDATNALNWWGHHHDKKIEQLLNSKLTSVKIAQENDWGFWQGTIVENDQQVREHLSQFPAVNKWMLKSPYGFSGIGHTIFDRDEFKVQIVQPMLLEPLYERVFDIGTTFIIKDGVVEDWFMVENFNNHNGSFRGGVGANDKKVFRDYILNKYQFDLWPLEKITNEIVDICIRAGAVNNIQIDSFVYCENGELKLYPLIEINYRKTMGLVIQALANKLTKETQLIEWLIFNKKEVSQTVLKNMECISPIDNHFLSFFRVMDK